MAKPPTNGKQTMIETPKQRAAREAEKAVRIAFTKAEDALTRAMIPYSNPAVAKEASEEAEAAAEAADAAYDAWVIAQEIATEEACKLAQTA